MSLTHRSVLAVLAGTLSVAAVTTASPAPAQADAAAPVERWHAALLGVMRDAQRLGVRGLWLMPVTAILR